MLHIVKIRVTLEIELSDGVLRSYLPASPQTVGSELATQVDRYSREQKLGYYPALDYFEGEPEVLDPNVLDAAQNIAWFAGNAVREEIQLRLRPVFSNVHLESTQCLAFTFPPVRMHQRNAVEHLAGHYTPNAFRLCLLLSSITKHEESNADVEIMTRKKVLSHLARHFNGIEITSVQVV